MDREETYSPSSFSFTGMGLIKYISGGQGHIVNKYRINYKASVTKRRGIGPIKTKISPYKTKKMLFIF